MVVAYVDSVMSRLGRHLSIQAALEQWGSWPTVDRPHATGLGATRWPPALTWSGPLAGGCPSAQGQAVTRNADSGSHGGHGDTGVLTTEAPSVSRGRGWGSTR